MHSDLLLRSWLYCCGMWFTHPSYSVRKGGFRRSLLWVKGSGKLLWVMLFRFYAVGCFCFILSVGLRLLQWAFVMGVYIYIMTFLFSGFTPFSFTGRFFFLQWVFDLYSGRTYPRLRLSWLDKSTRRPMYDFNQTLPLP
jgi:hypothetical protein